MCEAYCYIHWGQKNDQNSNTGCHNHGRTHAIKKKCSSHSHSHKSEAVTCHAVIQSNSIWLREKLSVALSNMENVEY